MSRIRVLPPQLVNRIAAGECVERPASVVKELVENALDAGATQVQIEVHDGGRELICVRDDGCGMSPDDLRLCVQPHATSKIAVDDDLFNIRTLGFRGEALPSIGSVSRLRLTSRPRSAELAYSVELDGGVLSGPTPGNAPPGTSVEVRDLFYCVPARRKFLRTTQTEMGQITEQLARLALPQPGVAFALRHGKRVMHSLAATDSLRQRIADLYGEELADVLLEISREGGGVRVEGLVAPPAESRGASKWEYVFVNGRFIRDRFVSHAVREAYRSLIDPARYPVVFLFVRIDPAHVDVNVHPTKVEVRWRDSNYIHGQVLAALRDRFLSTRLDAPLRPPAEHDAYRERVRAAMVDFFTGRRSDEVTALKSDAAEGARRHDGGRSDEAAKPRSGELGESAGGAFPSSFRHSVAASPSSARAIQLHNTYLVVETDDGLMIIDQHALHERVLYEELRRRIAERPLESQRLLLPEVVRVPADRIEALETHADTLARLGLDLTATGPNSVALHAFPSLLDRVDRAAFIRDLLDLLSER
ncbi:MAG: DNA mismatch repair endonuclease MutL, partial [Phycisphaerae bacterium]|nr:DNA mismatch repair endonuclease MutL [Phycisphaerae bacterium]